MSGVEIVLQLVSIDSPDGPYRFIVGTDGIFTDIEGQTWHGSRLVSGGDMKMSIQGEAPSGSLTLAFIPDPSGADLISQVRALGADYVRGRKVVFYDQPLASHEEFYAPTQPYDVLVTRVATGITFDLSGAMDRSITLHFEGAFTGLNTAPGWQYTTADHQRRFGTADTSLRLMPTNVAIQKNKLF